MSNKHSLKKRKRSAVMSLFRNYDSLCNASTKLVMSSFIHGPIPACVCVCILVDLLFLLQNDILGGCNLVEDKQTNNKQNPTTTNHLLVFAHLNLGCSGNKLMQDIPDVLLPSLNFQSLLGDPESRPY